MTEKAAGQASVKGYVINLDRQPERLARFYQHANLRNFTRLPAVDKQTLALISADFLFNINRLQARIARPVTLGEIACTLSHIKAWTAIANDDQLGENEFAVVAEDDVKLVAHFEACLASLLASISQTDTELVLLHKLGLYQPQPVFEGGALTVYSPESKASCDDDGSSLYLIRKSKAKQLVSLLENGKPYWLADHFSRFCDLDRLLILSHSLGEISPHSVSDLEAERVIARQHHFKNQ